MFKKSYTSRFLIDRSKIVDLKDFEYHNVVVAYLNKLFDSLDVFVRCTDDSIYELVIIDNSNSRKEMSYVISRDEYEVSYKLAGRKILHTKRYIVPNSIEPSRLMNVIVYDELDLMLCEYVDTTKLLIDTLPLEDWFSQDVTEESKYKESFLAIYNRI